MFSYWKKFPKFNKIVRNIFRGIFLQRKFPPENFPEFFEIKHSFTAVNLYFYKVHHRYKFLWEKGVVGQKNCQKSFPEVSGNIPGNSWIKDTNTCLQPVNYIFNAWYFMLFSPEFYPVGKNFRNLSKLSEIFSGEFSSGGNFPRGTFWNFSK
jgi:hypothetical protein